MSKTYILCAGSWTTPGQLPPPGQFCFESLQVASYQPSQHFLEHEVWCSFALVQWPAVPCARNHCAQMHAVQRRSLLVRQLASGVLPTWPVHDLVQWHAVHHVHAMTVLKCMQSSAAHFCSESLLVACNRLGQHFAWSMRYSALWFFVHHAIQLHAVKMCTSIHHALQAIFCCNSHPCKRCPAQNP